MPAIITNSELQKNIGKISRSLGEETPYIIVTIHGKGNMIVLPYFEKADKFVEEYLEDYVMWKNKNKLQKKYKESLESGESDLVI